MNTQLLNPLYWFSFQPAAVDSLFGKILLGVFLALFLLGIISRMVLEQRTHDRYVILAGKRLITCFITMGFIGLVLYFFSYENISVFGARFWYVIWFLGLIVWSVLLARFITRDIPALREKNQRDHAKSKYIPGRKRHSA